jgi:hypothetical protein
MGPPAASYVPTVRSPIGEHSKSAADRLIIGVLKALGFLTSEGAPTSRYYEFLDQSQARRVLGDGIREAYADLFQINRKAHEMSGPEIKNKLKTLTQGQASDSVLDKMVGTFKALVAQADLDAPLGAPTTSPAGPPVAAPAAVTPVPVEGNSPAPRSLRAVELGGLVYNIQLILPADRDKAVYDALFRSLKEHLLS